MLKHKKEKRLKPPLTEGSFASQFPWCRYLRLQWMFLFVFYFFLIGEKMEGNFIHWGCLHGLRFTKSTSMTHSSTMGNMCGNSKLE